MDILFELEEFCDIYVQVADIEQVNLIGVAVVSSDVTIFGIIFVPEL